MYLRLSVRLDRGADQQGSSNERKDQQVHRSSRHLRIRNIRCESSTQFENINQGTLITILNHFYNNIQYYLGITVKSQQNGLVNSDHTFFCSFSDQQLRAILHQLCQRKASATIQSGKNVVNTGNFC